MAGNSARNGILGLKLRLELLQFPQELALGEFEPAMRALQLLDALFRLDRPAFPLSSAAVHLEKRLVARLEDLDLIVVFALEKLIQLIVHLNDVDHALADAGLHPGAVGVLAV